MPEAHLHFHDNLNDFLAPQRRNVSFSHQFDGNPSVKDMIESLGVPHTEVALIMVNRAPVTFRYHVQDGDRIEVYSSCEHLDISPEHGVRPPTPDEIRFVADVHLGRLAAYLRMLGFDTLYPSDYRDEELARISSAENRVLLTRDRGLLKRSIVVYGYYVRETNPWRQLDEVLRRFDLVSEILQFHRCTRCNNLLSPVEKASVEDRLTPETRKYYNDFRLCHQCGKIYWRGSHFERMDSFIAQLRQA
ncbi:MAG TPA: Mut7-C RNAse domain-containing protein [Oceanobacillus sp.]|nr:Mut7-C RNAse domain-containing protein [Oceanobacillus sp.]